MPSKIKDTWPKAIPFPLSDNWKLALSLIALQSMITKIRRLPSRIGIYIVLHTLQHHVDSPDGLSGIEYLQSEEFCNMVYKEPRPLQGRTRFSF